MSSLSVDKPIEKKSEDFLGRKSFAETVTNAILEYDDKNSESLTIGLYGKWGSGKTSIINMVLEDIEKEDNVIFFKFEPWLYSDTQQLISHFFKDFSKAINHKDYGKEAEKIGKELETYATFFDTLSLIPEPTTSLISKGISKIFSSTGKASSKWGKLKSKSLSSTKVSIEKHLKKFDKKIVIVLDDIDRLNNTEIRQIFQMMKVLGNFPNTIYISSMDKMVVMDALAEVQKGDGSEYLEKIIHVPINVPSISKENVDEFLFLKLNEILVDVGSEDFDQHYWGNIYHSGFKYFFKNIRDVIRYINILKFNYSALKNEVNIIDLIAITGFQVFEPKIYELIKNNPEMFAGVIRDSSYSHDTSEEEKNIKAFFEDSYSQLEKLSEENYLNIMEELFIKITEVHNNTTYMGALQECRKDGKICSPEFFDIYFKLTINQNTISKYRMKIYIDTASSEDTFEVTIKSLIDKGVGVKFLHRLGDYIDEIEQEKYQVIISVLMNLGDLFPDEKNSMFMFGTKLDIARVFYQLLSKLENREDRFNILKKAIENAKESITISCYEISMLMESHGEYAKEAKADSEQIVTIEQLQELKEILKNKIETWFSSHHFLSLNDPLVVLYMWKKLDEDKVINYIEEKVKTNDELITFLVIFNSVNYSFSSGDYTERENKKFNYTSIKDFIDIENILARVEEIQENIDDYDTNEESKFSIKMFLEYYNGNISEDRF
ncbi:MAG: hypothetical protein K0U38_04030 [Epsilonproteobacteria bacterium]|nr:hypothetical protein [Campylobacterota bacterium]